MCLEVNCTNNYINNRIIALTHVLLYYTKLCHLYIRVIAAMLEL